MSLQNMNFLEMQNFVLGERFDSNQRDEVKNVLNTVYGLSWNSNQFDFRHAEANVSVVSGNPDLQDMPTDLGPIQTLVTGTGLRVDYQTPRQFFQYSQNVTETSSPSIYTRLGDILKLAPTPDTSATDWVVAYERRLTFMVEDADIPNWPAEHRYGVLVQGARAQMLAGENDPTFDAPQGYSEQSLTACVRDYISDRRFSLLQYGRDNVASGWVFE